MKKCRGLAGLSTPPFPRFCYNVEFAIFTSLTSFKMDQPKQACNNCRRRKIKCSRELPCDKCQRLLLSCSYSDVLRRKGPKFRTLYPLAPGNPRKPAKPAKPAKPPKGIPRRMSRTDSSRPFHHSISPIHNSPAKTFRINFHIYHRNSFHRQGRQIQQSNRQMDMHFHVRDVSRHRFCSRMLMSI